jgi:molybdopterin synthase sulfur carrier subunit
VIVQVQLFAGARELAGATRVTLDLPEGATVGQLRAALLAHHPALARYGRALWIAVNNAYAADDAPLPSAAEIACFPPVSGG